MGRKKWIAHYGGRVGMPDITETLYSSDNEVPGQVVMRERPEEHGVADGFILVGIKTQQQHVWYHCVSLGATPEEVVTETLAAVANGALPHRDGIEVAPEG